MTKIIKVLGTGCSKCTTTIALVNEVIKENAIDAVVEKVEDIMEIMEFNVMSTPALVIDNLVVIKGRVPSKDEVFSLLKNPAEEIIDNSTSCSSGKCCSSK